MRYRTCRHKRSGIVHISEDTGVEGYSFTLCGRRVRPSRFKSDGTRMMDAECNRCWTVLAYRAERMRKQALRIEMAVARRKTAA